MVICVNLSYIITRLQMLMAINRMNHSLSEQYLHALAQLPQFAPYVPHPMLQPHAVHVLTGARVFAVLDPLAESHGLLRVQFAAGLEIEVHGAQYLALQRAEARIYAAPAAGEALAELSQAPAPLHAMRCNTAG